MVTGNNIASQNGQSAGCNVVGLYSMIGPYYIESSAIGSTIDVQSKSHCAMDKYFKLIPRCR